MKLQDPPGRTAELAADNRKTSAPLFFAYAVLVSIILTIAICALSSLIVRNLDHIYSVFAPHKVMSLTELFYDIESSGFDVHVLLPALISLAFTLSVGMCVRHEKNKAHPVFFALISILCAAVLFSAALYASVTMTDVCGVALIDAVV
ncbi:MAG: hypothetical protein ACI4XJ_07335 [Eubacteriales bacterium]